MNTTKTIILTIAAIIAIAIFLSVINLLLCKIKPQSETDFKIKSAYGIWFAGLFTGSCLTTARIIPFLSEAIDNIYKIGKQAPLYEVAKTTSLFTGLGLIWFLFCYFIAVALSVIVLGTRKDPEEMQLNNTHLFLVKALILVGLIFTLSPALDLLFRMVTPNIPLPFYH